MSIYIYYRQCWVHVKGNPPVWAIIRGCSVSSVRKYLELLPYLTAVKKSEKRMYCAIKWILSLFTIVSLSYSWNISPVQLFWVWFIAFEYEIIQKGILLKWHGSHPKNYTQGLCLYCILSTVYYTCFPKSQNTGSVSMPCSIRGKLCTSGSH